MSALDPRLHAYRADLADIRLKGRVDAERFVEGRAKRVAAAAAPLRRAPRADAPLDTEALFGETVRVFEETVEGWAWVQLVTDGYVGWCPAATLDMPAASPPTHRVQALRTWAYPGPDIKLPPLMLLSLNARVAVRREEGQFAETDAGYVFARHLAPLDRPEPDWVGIAARFVGTPYLWGGRTSVGLDCSALVQLALAAAGRPCPRDSDMQEQALGSPVEMGDPAMLERGDLLFWKGHVAIATGNGMLLHANGHHMDTVIEPLEGAVDRIAAAGLQLISVRRP